MTYRRIDDLLQAAKGRKAGRVAIAAAHDGDVLKAAAAAAEEGIAEPILGGEGEAIRKILLEIGRDSASFGINPSE